MRKGLRIALMGTASVGKSTTAWMLHDYTGIELHTEIESRLIKKRIKMGIIKDKTSFTPEQSKAFQNSSLRIRERLSLRDSFISDRTAGELWVYHQIYCANYSTEAELARFKSRCYGVMKRYTNLFLFPFGTSTIVDNNYRNIDPEYQVKVHELIERMLFDFDLKYVPLEKRTMTKQERFEEVCLWLPKE